jgi:hypothetical protein
VPGLFILNSLVYLALLLGWSAVLRAVVRRAGSTPRRSFWVQAALGLVLWAGPFALSPLYLPPPEARVHGEPQRIAINAGREVYMYDQLAPALVLRVGLEDVRPRPDGQSGMRVCLRLYTYFYLPIGHMALDMTVEGVHSNNGEVLSMEASCWK